MEKFLLQINLFLVLLFFISLVPAQAQVTPAATIEGDAAVCESGLIELKISFQGNFPFGFIYKNLNGDQWLRTDPIFENDLVDGYYIESVPVSNSDRFELVEFFDDNTVGGWTAGNGYTNVSGSATIRVDRTPVPDAGGNAIGCGYSYALNAIPQDPANETFWDDVANGSFNDKNAPDAVFTASIDDTYTLTFNERSGTCIGQDQVTITLNGSPKSTISGETTICSTDGNVYTLNATVNLEGNAPFRYTYSDTYGSEQVKYNQPAGNSTLMLLPNSANEYSIIEIMDDNGCFADKIDMQGSAIANDNKPNTFAGDNDIACFNGSANPIDYTLKAIASDGATGAWSSVSAGVSFSDANAANSQVTANDFGIYTFTWTETFAGCVNSDDVEIKFNPNPTLSLTNTATDICEGEEAVMEITTTAASYAYPLNLDYSYDTNSASESITSSPSSINFSPSGTTTYTLQKITDKHGCYSDLTNEYIVNVHTIPVANAGSDDQVCNNSLELNAQVAEGNHGIWNANVDYFDDPTKPNAIFSIPEGEQKATEDFLLTWTEFNGANTNCSDQQSITITFDQLAQDINIVKDTTLYNNDNSVMLIGESKNNMHEDMLTIWETESNGVTISDKHNSSTEITDIERGSHLLTWTIKNGSCDDIIDSVIITQRALTAPNGFSPDGDGINDFFRIGGSEQISNHEFIVFDINGKLVYSTNNLTANGWDAKGVDGEVKDGTYYYIFKGDDIKPIKEYLVIKRK